MDIMEVVQRHPDIVQVIGALGAPSRLTGILNRRQQQGDQDADDGNHDQQFD